MKITNQYNILEHKAKINFVNERYNHFALLFHKDQVLSFGTNHYISNTKTVHAELNVWKNLKPILSNKKKNICLMVIRISGTGVIGNSKCCSHCLRNINKLSERKGYKIKYIYYSDKNGNIVKSNLNKLISTTNHKSSIHRA